MTLRVLDLYFQIITIAFEMKRLLLLFFALVFCAAFVSSAKGPVRVGGKLPGIVLKDLDGRYVHVSKLCDIPTKRDKKKCAIVVNVFKIICKPCELELPALKRFQKDWAGKGAILVMMGFRENENAIKRYAAKNNLEGIIVLSDRYGNALETLGLGKRVPRTLVIDSNLTIKHITYGGTAEIYDELSEKVEPLLNVPLIPKTEDPGNSE